MEFCIVQCFQTHLSLVTSSEQDEHGAGLDAGADGVLVLAESVLTAWQLVGARLGGVMARLKHKKGKGLLCGSLRVNELWHFGK